jgi:flavodoxin
MTGATMRRRTLLTAMAGAGTLALASVQAGCSAPAPRRPRTGPSPSTRPSNQEPDPTTMDQNRVLLAYFSRAGENYYYGDRTNLTVGNTEVLARMIARRIDCDLHRIEAAQPYPEDYEATVARNVAEQDSDARPAIANPLSALDGYDIVLLASPIWNVRPPRIMTTFAEGLDFDGRRVHPLTTHAMSGLGTAERDYARTCPGATLAEGLAVQGEKVAGAGATIDAWLRRTRLTQT